MTARALFHRCRKAGIILAADGDAITFDGPPGVVIAVNELRQLKPELLPVLNGDYLSAAIALARRVSVPLRREALAQAFDQRVGDRLRGTSRGEGLRWAYIQMARA